MSKHINFNHLVDTVDSLQLKIERLLAIVDEHSIKPIERLVEGGGSDAKGLMKLVLPIMDFLKDSASALERTARMKVLLKSHYVAPPEEMDRASRRKMLNYIEYLKEAERFEAWMDACCGPEGTDDKAIYSDEENAKDLALIEELKQKQRDAGMPEDFGEYTPEANPYLRWGRNPEKKAAEEKAKAEKLARAGQGGITGKEGGVNNTTTEQRDSTSAMCEALGDPSSVRSALKRAGVELTKAQKAVDTEVRSNLRSVNDADGV